MTQEDVKETPETKQKRSLSPDATQRKASDPAVSAWVTASAGTGKTKVLTDRILRLLIEGADPADILCITFTNAAAAVMKNRLHQELSTWASCPERELSRRLKVLTGKPPEKEMLAAARMLFARVLETPGGMKIQTVHSFSQSLLRRFPIESGAPPYFKVADEREAEEILHRAEVDILNQARDEPESPLGTAVRTVTSLISDEEFQTLIRDFTQQRVILRKTFDLHGGLEPTIQAIYKYMEVNGNKTYFQELSETCADEGLDSDTLLACADALKTGSATDQARGEALERWLRGTNKERMAFFDDYVSVFFTQKGELRKKMISGKKDPDDSLSQTMMTEAERLSAAQEKLNRLNVARNTAALLTLGQEILKAYAQYKKEKNQLDFDDLVYMTADFLADRDTTAWALEKLDGNLKHILIDEAQDTNPEQWDIAYNLARELFTEKEKAKGKTIFVVGDEKQSIYSFLRADLAVFNGTHDKIKSLVEKSGGKWRDVQMDMSFRSVPAVLETVDAVFADPAAADGLGLEKSGGKLKHQPNREGQAGSVRVHPPVCSVFIHGQNGNQPQSWPLPLSIETMEEPSRRLAGKIADMVGGWLDSGETLPSRDRPVIPSDILILVRRRSSLVDNLVRELKHRNIPVAGPDRMSLWEEIGVRDLISLGQFLLAPDDDMNLAITLQSPLIGLDEPQVREILLERPGTLWEALAKKAGETGAEAAAYRRAHEYLSGLVQKTRTERPYNLYSFILNSACPSDSKQGTRGWTAIQKRLGTEVNDALVEFVNAAETFERGHAPTLQGFLSWLEEGQSDIRREINLESAEPKIHLMTVHSAKGLQAPIVLLPDTMGLPSDNIKARPRFLLPTDTRNVPIWIPRSDMETPGLTVERQKAELSRDQEYRRLLYVAMTRAEDRLEIFGYSSNREPTKNCWYSLMRNGVMSLLPPEVAAEQSLEKPVVHTGAQTAKPAKEKGKDYKKKALMPVPAWASRSVRAASETVLRFTRDIKGAKPPQNDNKPREDAPKNSAAAPSLTQNKEADTPATLRGKLIHRLLEFVPALPSQEHKDAIHLFVRNDGSNLTLRERAAVSMEVQKVLKNPELSFIFGANALPEVPFQTLLTTENGQKVSRPGQIDRLVVTDKEIWVIDFKSNTEPPQSVAEVSDDYLLQMASYRDAVRQLFPDKTINCGFVWTHDNRLQKINDETLDGALGNKGLKTAQRPRPAKKTQSTEPF